MNRGQSVTSSWTLKLTFDNKGTKRQPIKTRANEVNTKEDDMLIWINLLLLSQAKAHRYSYTWVDCS